jgi:hypothetical protein
MIQDSARSLVYQANSTIPVLRAVLLLCTTVLEFVLSVSILVIFTSGLFASITILAGVLPSQRAADSTCSLHFFTFVGCRSSTTSYGV